MTSPRLECPVCVGLLMEKHRPDGRADVELDLCPRCGGIWFEAGEVQLLRAGSRFDAPAGTETPHLQRCHSCAAVLSRDDASCAACGYKNVLECPSCDAALTRERAESVVLDACRSCRGIWFDRHEIAAVWSLVLTTAVATSAHAQSVTENVGATMDVGSGVLEALMYSPDLGVALVHGAREAASVAVELAAATPELAAAVAEAAAAVFEALIAIVAAILEGL